MGKVNADGEMKGGMSYAGIVGVVRDDGGD